MISRHLPRKDYRLLLKLAELKQFKRGDVIVHPGGWKHKPVYIIKQGLVAIYGSSTRAAHFVHVVYGPGELFPVSGLNVRTKDPSMYIGAKAETTLEVYVVPRKMFDSFMNNSVERKHALLAQVVDQFKLYTYRIENLEYPRARERVAYRLLLTASRFGYLKSGSLAIPKISSRTVASALNISEEVVSREMCRLRELKIISYAPGLVYLLDAERLQNQIGNDVRIPFRYLKT